MCEKTHSKLTKFFNRIKKAGKKPAKEKSWKNDKHSARKSSCMKNENQWDSSLRNHKSGW